jgi:predicted glycoside hydrolase/deacetylase ChbG (UPF0249 family)
METRFPSLSAVVLTSALLALTAGSTQAQVKTVAERLGYPADAKLLIIHADDLALAHSVDAASFAALDQKAATSASVMVTCPWLTEVVAYAKAHPDADLGIHTTLTSEWDTYRWGSVAPRDQVPTLFDPQGYFWADFGGAASHMKPEEAEREIRAQMERALQLGIRPTHLDNHMGTLFANPALLAVYLKVAREYRLPFLAVRLPNLPAEMLSQLKDTDIVLDALVSPRQGLRPEEWKEGYLEVIGNLKPGLSQLIVHLGYDDAELQTITVNHPDFGAAWRQRDFNVITSPEFKNAVEENHVILIGWKDLKKLLP